MDIGNAALSSTIVDRGSVCRSVETMYVRNNLYGVGSWFGRAQQVELHKFMPWVMGAGGIYWLGKFIQGFTRYKQ